MVFMPEKKYKLVIDKRMFLSYVQFMGMVKYCLNYGKPDGEAAKSCKRYMRKIFISSYRRVKMDNAVIDMEEFEMAVRVDERAKIMQKRVDARRLEWWKSEEKWNC